MSIYKTISVNASLTPLEIGASSAVSGNLSAEAALATNVEHSLVMNYNTLQNKPQVNSVELVGNKTLPEIGVDTISNIELENILQ